MDPFIIPWLPLGAAIWEHVIWEQPCRLQPPNDRFETLRYQRCSEEEEERVQPLSRLPV